MKVHDGTEIAMVLIVNRYTFYNSSSIHNFLKLGVPKNSIVLIFPKFWLATTSGRFNIFNIIFPGFDHHAPRGRARAVVASAGHDGRGHRHAAPLGAGTLAARMGPAHQKSDRRASSDASLIFSPRNPFPNHTRNTLRCIRIT